MFRFFMDTDLERNVILVLDAFKPTQELEIFQKVD